MRMAQAAGLYLFPFSTYRQGNVRNLVKFLIPGPSKICKKSIVPYGPEKNSVYRKKDESIRMTQAAVLYLSPFSRYRPWKTFRSRVKIF